MTEKKNWIDKFTSLDRRWIFVFVAISVVIPVLLKLTTDVHVSPSVRSVYEYIEAIPEGGTVLIACDFDPASEAELAPMTKALFRHCFDNRLKVISFTLWPNGAALIEKTFNELEKEYQGIEQGADYVNLGYQVGGYLVILAAGQDMYTAFPTDYRGNTTQNMAVMEGIRTLTDLDYILDLAAGSTVDWWVAFGVARYGFTMGAGCTAVSATQYYPYLNTGQLNGLLGGMKGAAEYEQLIEHKDRGLAGMVAQSSVHALIIVLVILSNVFYFMSKRQR